MIYYMNVIIKKHMGRNHSESYLSFINGKMIEPVFMIYYEYYCKLYNLSKKYDEMYI